MDRSVDRYWDIYHIQTHLATYLDVHWLGFKAMIFKIAILRAINAGFPSCLLRKSHTERFGKSRATEIRNIRILDRYLPLHKIRVLCYSIHGGRSWVRNQLVDNRI